MHATGKKATKNLVFPNSKNKEKSEKKMREEKKV